MHLPALRALCRRFGAPLGFVPVGGTGRFDPARDLDRVRDYPRRLRAFWASSWRPCSSGVETARLENPFSASIGTAAASPPDRQSLGLDAAAIDDSPVIARRPSRRGSAVERRVPDYALSAYAADPNAALSLESSREMSGARDGDRAWQLAIPRLRNSTAVEPRRLRVNPARAALCVNLIRRQGELAARRDRVPQLPARRRRRPVAGGQGSADALDPASANALTLRQVKPAQLIVDHGAP